ncbi:hypothetical protein POM88_028888 [Heracleum sosnowskyi]|uniref:Uncharacterized protein n=1 Tax=Heracleum sosnowskyi TaxID=360622 RepID=A0AAD8HSW4_9APIA|nr:hypothetical protein POM88_028888 [Heracleum sosnowskyi]
MLLEHKLAFLVMVHSDTLSSHHFCRKQKSTFTNLGLSEEVRAASACAGEEVTIRNRFSKMNTPKDSSFVNKYYNLAHIVNERVFRQPSMLRAGTLRDYQIVGLQWMLSFSTCSDNSTSGTSNNLEFSVSYFKQAVALLAVTFVVTNHMPLGVNNAKLTEDDSAFYDLMNIFELNGLPSDENPNYSGAAEYLYQPVF